ncbi:hypothetical protein PTE30175_05205 [Pandoraea terrae]|uniref:Uncharacterized protein n=1 Tax=Pandoraea terrae TaxID=1537710 RepID=A0A5E4ZB30_9BURK|nr:hypothetical protein [Pandoraea terrae]VVE58236.1 hypothetical protein PTE30175_05205 [Pandoraea terrae]
MDNEYEDDDAVRYYEDPSVFESDAMRTLHQEQFDKFVEFRIRGISSNVAFAKAFPRYSRPGDLRNAMERVTYLESTDWYIDEFEKRLAAKTAQELWPVNTAINRLLQRVEDPAEKGSTRVLAIKELNVLTGITVEEGGQTKAGRSLEDFYTQFAGAPGSDSVRH